MSMNFRRSALALSLGIACCTLVTRHAAGQEDAPAKAPATRTPEAKADADAVPKAKADDADPAARFKAVNAEWQALDKRLTELQKTYGNATAPAARAEVKKQYEELVARSLELIPELHKAAQAAYEAAPNQDAEVTRTLLGIANYALHRDEYEKALELAQAMEAKGCKEPALFAVAGKAAYQMDDYAAAEKYLTLADKGDKLDPAGQGLLLELPEQQEAWKVEQERRKKDAEADDLPRVKMETSKGTIVIELFENEAPQTVGNFVSLVESKFYDGLTFHRVLPGFMAQGGDPDGTGGGGPGYEIYCECEKPEARKHFRGTLSMAHAGKNTGGSQFFLTFRPTTHLNGRHTAFGRVIEGMDVLAKLQRRDPTRPNPPAPDKIVKAEVVRKRDHKYAPTKVK